MKEIYFLELLTNSNLFDKFKILVSSEEISSLDIFLEKILSKKFQFLRVTDLKKLSEDLLSCSFFEENCSKVFFIPINLIKKNEIEFLVKLIESNNNIFIIESEFKEFLNLENSAKITITEDIKLDEYKLIYNLFYPDLIFNPGFYSHVLKFGVKINLNAALQLCKYQCLIGSKFEDFDLKWINLILKSDLSIFILLQYFFSRDQKEFIKYWNKYSDLFNQEFWIVVFIERIISAYWFLESKYNSKLLPFSFIKKDWKLFEKKELINCLNFLYKADWLTKNGYNSDHMSLFFAKFFKLKFKN